MNTIAPSEAWDKRYAANWPTLSRRSRELAGDQCLLCSAPATEVHHALYADARGAIAGREIPGVHIFPLCTACHQGEGGAHDSAHWFHDFADPIAGNHQSPAYYQKLRSAWVAKVHQKRSIKQVQA